METGELKKYLNPGIGMIIFGLIITAAATLIAVFMNPAKTIIPRWLVIGAGIIFGPGFILVGISLRRDYRKFFKGLDKVELDKLGLEFNAAEKRVNDKFRTGEKHVFIKSTPKLIAYGDIKDIFIKVRKDNHNRVTSRSLEVSTNKEAVSTELCRFTPSEQYLPTAKSFYDFVFAKNPGVTFQGQKIFPNV